MRARRGVAVDQTARLRAYSEAREFLAADSTIDPPLRVDMLHHLNHLALNPLENGLTAEATVAQEQYAALLQYATSPEGLAAQLDRDRKSEMEAYTRSTLMRFLAGTGRLPQSSRKVPADERALLLAQLDWQRRTAYHVRFVQALLASSARPEVNCDTGEIQHSIEALVLEPKAKPRAARLIAQLLKRTDDSQLRIVCLRALSDPNLAQGRIELQRLSENPNATSSLRTLCVAYLKGGAEEPSAFGLGTQ